MDRVYRDINYYSYSIKYNNRYEIQVSVHGIGHNKNEGRQRTIFCTEM